MDRNGNQHIVTPRLVFLFKAYKENHATDKYEEILGLTSIPFIVIPVLTFEFVNKDLLTSLLLQPENWSAIILTSTRAVQAVDNALRSLKNPRDIVTAIQCFVVGQATHDAAVTVGFHPEGCDSGNGDALAEYIIKNIKDSSRSLLFPCSNIHRESIPKKLKSQGLMITELVAYETHPDKYMEENVKTAVQNKGFPEFAAFFSPSGFNCVHSFLNKLPLSLDQTKIIALGPTTAAAITDKGYEVYDIADKPDPESLLHILQKSK